MLKEINDNALSKMEATCYTFKEDLKGLRTGKATYSILDGVLVHVYNDNMRLNQISTVSIASNKLLTVSVWDRDNAEIVNKAIANSNLGLNPNLEGSTIKIPLPDLSEERRKELTKVASDYAERTKIALRNVRRDSINQLKNLSKDKEISEDDLHKAIDTIQKLTNETESKVDRMLQTKTKEILEN